MLIYIVSAILAFDIIRLLVQLRDSRRVNALNKAAIARAEVWESEHKALQQAEIEELRAMAKDSGRMAQMAEDFKRQMEGGKG